ncbi:hypothetical protein [Parapedobacter lycopersici]|uniref:hypothetical protein n=1 Tax=Parapedobacter lycopersici TaxID=1864939 RepID=UPI003342A4C2
MDSLQSIWTKVQHATVLSDTNGQSLEDNLKRLRQKERTRKIVGVLMLPLCILILAAFIYLIAKTENYSYYSFTLTQIIGFLLVIVGLLFLIRQFRKSFIDFKNLDFAQPSNVFLGEIQSKLRNRRKWIALGTAGYLAFFIPGMYLLLTPFLTTVTENSMFGILCGSSLGIGAYSTQLQRVNFDKNYRDILNKIDVFLND